MQELCNDTQGNEANETEETVSECRMCRERGKTWNGDDPKCAFPDGAFATSNWNCATANALRDISQSWVKNGENTLTWSMRDDNAAASFGVITAWDDSRDVRGYVVMSWYKSRGRLGQAWLMCDDETPRPLTLAEAEDVIASYRKERK